MSAPRDPAFDRPIIIISPPRSGSTLLFETLARAPALYTVGGESQRVIEGLAPLSMPARGYESNVLTAADATAPVIDELRARFGAELRDREGRRPRQIPLRMLEKTPKNILRIPFLAHVFPEARFVYLYREPRQVMASMMETWASGRFRTYADLPGWTGLPWTHLLIPGWRALIGKPLAEITATQWRVASDIGLESLAALPRERVMAIRYEEFLQDWGMHVSRICSAMDIEWDQPLTGELARSRSTVSAPRPDKWREREGEITPYLPELEAAAARAERFLDSLS